NVGFIHGVMNTDNMALSGETIDYGPCAFMEAFDPATVFSSIDHAGRYAYANQPRIAQWNLARFAEALLPVIDADGEAAVQAATEVLNAFPARHAAHLLHGRRAKLGLAPAGDADTADDTALADDFLGLLHAQHVDFTRAWWHLADAAEGRAEPLREQFTDLAAIDAWLARWRARCAADDGGTTSTERAVARAARMRRTNPRVIARNHRVEEALTAASDHADLGPFEQLLDAVRRPFDVDPALDRYAEPAPVDVTARYRTFCGT
nr:protein adenylyltransferase SelO family protein [Burkholderiales bacterium]